MGKKEPKLSWEAVLEQFENLIKFASKQQIMRNPTMNDTMVSAEDLYQEGLIKLYDCWVKWCVEEDKDMDEFGPIFRTSLFRRMRHTTKRFLYVDIDDVSYTLEGEEMTLIDDMHKEHMINSLRDSLDSPIAKKVFSEIVQPSDRTMYEMMADRARKTMLKSQGKRVNVPKSVEIRMKHISKSLNLTKKQYDNAMSEIKKKAKVLREVELDY